MSFHKRLRAGRRSSALNSLNVGAGYHLPLRVAFGYVYLSLLPNEYLLRLKALLSALRGLAIRTACVASRGTPPKDLGLVRRFLMNAAGFHGFEEH